MPSSAMFFALVVFLCDGLLSVSAEVSSSAPPPLHHLVEEGSQILPDRSLSPHGAADGAVPSCVWILEEQCAHQTL